MDFIYAGLILFLVAIAVFLGQITIQFIKLEHKLQATMEVLEEELVDVFGSSSFKPKEAPKETPAAAAPAPPSPPKKPAGRDGDRKPAKPEPSKGGPKAPKRK